MYKRIALAALSVAALSSGAFAQAFTYNGTGGAVTDNATLTVDIVVGDTGTISTFDNTMLNIAHTFAGDLTFSLTHVETATTVIFMQRPGKTLTGSGFGNGGNFGTAVGTVPAAYTFDNTPSTSSSANSIWLASASADIPSGTYGASRNDFTGTAATSHVANTFSAFVGQSITGTWRLSVADGAAGDTGTVGAWSINGSLLSAAAPEPGSLALLGLVALPGVAILRRKK